MFLRPPEAKRRGGDGGGGIGKAREMRVEFAMRQRGPRFAFFHSLPLSLLPAGHCLCKCASRATGPAHRLANLIVAKDVIATTCAQVRKIKAARLYLSIYLFAHL